MAKMELVVRININDWPALARLRHDIDRIPRLTPKQALRLAWRLKRDLMRELKRMRRACRG